MCAAASTASNSPACDDAGAGSQRASQSPISGRPPRFGLECRAVFAQEPQGAAPDRGDDQHRDQRHHGHARVQAAGEQRVERLGAHQAGED